MGAVNGPPRPPFGVAVPAPTRALRLGCIQIGWIGRLARRRGAIVVGTFLPWLHSGSVGKNSYQLAGVGQRRLELPGWADALLVGWPFLGPALAVLAALLASRLRRTVAWMSMAIGTCRRDARGAGAHRPRRDGPCAARPAYAGPLLTAVGAASSS